MKQQDQIDLFYLGEETTPVGTLITRTDEGTYSTVINFALPDGNVVAGALHMETAGSVQAWSVFNYEADGKKIRGERTDRGVRLHGKVFPVDGDVIPGYACSALVVELANSTDESISFAWVLETADEPVQQATLVKAGTESVDSPVRGTVEDCAKIELTVDGARTNTYWVKGPTVVASDWAGARSFALPDPVVRSLSKSRP